MKKLIIALLTLGMTLTTFAQEQMQNRDEENLTPIVLSETYEVKSGDTKIIPLPRYTFIDRLTFEVKQCFFCGKDSFRIAFDGYNMQTVQISSGIKGFKTKIMTVDARTRTIEVYNSGNCTIKIKGITVLPRRWQRGQSQYPGTTYGPVSDAAAQVGFLMETLLYVENLVSDSERVQFISPAKKVLGRALAVLNNSPETSQSSLKAIKEVLNCLAEMRPFVDKLATIEMTFEVAQEIQSVESALERMIR